MEKPKKYAVIRVSEMTNTVSVHFEGFSDYEDAKDFSRYIGKELNIEMVDGLGKKIRSSSDYTGLK